jgi:hypothetical protein
MKAADGMPIYEAASMLSAWRKASRCAGGECVEVGQRAGVIALRDSTQPGGTVLECAASEWRSLVTHIKAGAFDGLRS